MDRFLKSPDNNAVPNRIALIQAVLALGAGAVLLPVLGAVAAYSAVLAGSISALSTWYSGRKVFSSRARSTEQFVRNLYLAYFMKLLLVIALFCIVFASVPVNFPVFVVTYAATLAVYGWALVINERTVRG